MVSKELRTFLDNKVKVYNQPEFIPEDPISIPHQFTKLQDIEIIGLWAALLSWGQRKTIISKSLELCEIMDFAPYQFIMDPSDRELQKLAKFKHRTFNGDDALCMAGFFKWYYSRFHSLEDAFLADGHDFYDRMKYGIENFYQLFVSAPDFLKRTQKHVASPFKKSACKRINMFLRWMVRNDPNGVDFGLWRRLSPAQLMIPLDVHVFRIASSLGLLQRKTADWNAVEELTKNLRSLCPEDPVKYDFALFGLGVMEKNDPLSGG